MARTSAVHPRGILAAIPVFTLAIAAAGQSSFDLTNAWPNKTEVTLAKEVTVKPRTGAAERWTLSTGHSGGFTRSVIAVAGAGNETLIVETDGSSRNVALAYDGGRVKGRKLIRNGKVVEDTLSSNSAAMRRLRDLQSRVDAFGRKTGAKPEFEFTASPGNTAGINWDCEKAALNVIVWCGALQIGKCGEMVNTQYCACAPEPKPPTCK